MGNEQEKRTRDDERSLQSERAIRANQRAIESRRLVVGDGEIRGEGLNAGPAVRGKVHARLASAGWEAGEGVCGGQVLKVAFDP